MITNELISEIKSKINDNHKQDITGGVLQGVLVDMVKGLSEAYPQIYTEEQKAQARANIDALSDYDGAITKEKLSLEVQAILNDVANKQNITDESLATIAKTIVGAINEVYNGGLKDASIATNKIKDGAITEPKLDTDLVNVITSAVQPTELASAIATALSSYVAKSDIVDTTGSATDKVMSQHGVTEAINGVTNTVTELQTQINGKQDALTLTVKDNGNIVISNIQGQSKEFMPATPSGDPMHYAYVTAGAEYNDTGEDIVKTAPWADMADDDADKTVVHKAGYWYLNGLGDITNEQMRQIYGSTLPLQNNWTYMLAGQNVRTNFMTINDNIDATTNIINVGSNPFRNSSIEIVRVPTHSILLEYSMTIDIINAYSLKHILGVIKISKSATSYGMLSLRTVKIYGLLNNCNYKYSKELSVKSVLYMINNEAATQPITITLHADVYNRCMANADILAALEAHPNISLASA